MASGHVNRIQRPNTWLHRPTLRREDSPCQLGAVHTWPFATLTLRRLSGRFRGIADTASPAIYRRSPVVVHPEGDENG